MSEFRDWSGGGEQPHRIKSIKIWDATNQISQMFWHGKKTTIKRKSKLEGVNTYLKSLLLRSWGRIMNYEMLHSDILSQNKSVSNQKTQDSLSNKTTVSGMGNFLSSCWSGSSQKTPEEYRLLLLPLVALVRSSCWRQHLTIKDTAQFGRRSWRREVGTDLGDLSLRTSSCGTWRWYASKLTRKGNPPAVLSSCKV